MDNVRALLISGTVFAGLALGIAPEPAYAERITRENALSALQAPSTTGKADLNAKDMSGLDLSSVNFRSANLSAANLNGARLHNSILDGCNLTVSFFEGADLSGASLKHAVLFSTQMAH